MASESPTLVKRLVVLAAIAAALVFAIQGGEYGTLDLIKQRREKARVTHSIDSLRHVVDSLAKYADRVQHDPATQERIAREVFGMVRGDKEILYRFTDRPDSARRPAKSP
jgi:cell division protein FtsB